MHRVDSKLMLSQMAVENRTMVLPDRKAVNGSWTNDCLYFWFVYGGCMQLPEERQQVDQPATSGGPIQRSAMSVRRHPFPTLHSYHAFPVPRTPHIMNCSFLTPTNGF
jgi:hypothetical protein